MLIVAGIIEVAPEQRAEFLAGRAAAIRATRVEPGCLEYCFSEDSLQPGIVRLFERWTDADALATHLKVVAKRSRTSPDTVTVLRREISRYEASEAMPLTP